MEKSFIMLSVGQHTHNMIQSNTFKIVFKSTKKFQPQYYSTQNFDFALLKLSTPVPVSSKANYACLPSGF